MTIVKDNMPLGDHCMHYSDDWESLLPFKVQEDEKNKTAIKL